jgi:CheY-like chemotaxis protein
MWMLWIVTLGTVIAHKRCMNQSPFPSLPVSSACDVLIVEDDVIQCEELGEYLARAGLRVEAAHDGATALQRAATHRPRVALLDYNLPDVTGVYLAEQLRGLLPQTAIIIMSGRIDGLPEQKLAELGIAAFVNKPPPLRALRDAVVTLAGTASVSQRRNDRPLIGLSTDPDGTRT